MKLDAGLFLFVVVASVFILSEGASPSTETKKHRKQKKRQQQVDNTFTNEDAIQTDNHAVVNQSDPNTAEDEHDLLDITPSEEHNGKLNNKHRKKAKAAARKQQRKEQRRLERNNGHNDRNDHNNEEHGETATLTRKQKKKQAKKAARKELRKLKKQEAGTEIVSFDDIVQDRHGGPIPNPIPPVEGTATESQNTVIHGDDPSSTANDVLERHDQLQSKRERKRMRKHRHIKSNRICESNSDCGHGRCCVVKKGQKYCKHAEKNEGEKCVDDCMCRSELVCVSQLVAPGKERGLCGFREEQHNAEVSEQVDNEINSNQ